jgi:hypothetical protein
MERVTYVASNSKIDERPCWRHEGLLSVDHTSVDLKARWWPKCDGDRPLAAEWTVCLRGCLDPSHR